jgi:hypothetical protein
MYSPLPTHRQAPAPSTRWRATTSTSSAAWSSCSGCVVVVVVVVVVSSSSSSSLSCSSLVVVILCVRRRAATAVAPTRSCSHNSVRQTPRRCWFIGISTAPPRRVQAMAEADITNMEGIACDLTSKGLQALVDAIHQARSPCPVVAACAPAPNNDYYYCSLQKHRRCARHARTHARAHHAPPPPPC